MTTFTSTRIKAAALAIACCALLITAASLQPNTQGLGTHKQLGLNSCNWLTTRGYVCPSCGMTTSFALAANNNLLASAKTQPAGFTLALLTAITAWIAAWIAFKGPSILNYLQPLYKPKTIATAFATLIITAWYYKITITS